MQYHVLGVLIWEG